MQRCMIDYWRPAEALLPYVMSYSRFHVGDDPGVFVTEPFFGPYVSLRITTGRRGWSFAVGNRRYPQVPPIAVFGTNSRLGFGSTDGETAFGAGLSPRGWARFAQTDAAFFADQVTATERLGAFELHGLAASLRAGADVPATMNAFFLAALAGSQPEPAVVAILEQLLADPAVRTVHELAERSGLTAVQLGRIVPRHFGFTPKRLMRRRRFMAVLMRARALPRGHWAEAIEDSDYFDQAHFLRDCQSFLGMPLGRFLALQTPMSDESLRKRAAVRDASMQPPQVAADAPRVAA